MRSTTKVLMLAIPLASCGSSGEPSPNAIKQAPIVQHATIANSPSLSAQERQAQQLVQEFLQRDEAGERLQTSPWFQSVFLEPDHEPGYDSFTAVRRSEIVSAKEAGSDTVRVQVRYAIAGSIEQAVNDSVPNRLKFVPHDTTEVVVFPIVKTAHGLKIDSPQIDQHVRILTILNGDLRTRLTPKDRDALMSAASR